MFLLLQTIDLNDPRQLMEREVGTIMFSHLVLLCVRVGSLLDTAPSLSLLAER